MPMPPPTRIAPAAPGDSSRGSGEAVAERAVDPDPLARLERAEPVGARADRPRPGSRAGPPSRRLGVGDREGPRQEGPAAVAPPSGARRRACRTGPARGSGPSRVEQREDAVAAGGAVLGRPRRAGARTGRGHRRARVGPASRRRGSPAGERTSASPCSLRGDRPHRRRGAGHRRHAGDAVADRGGADLVAVGAGAGAGRRVDHQVAAPLADQVDDVRRALADLVDRRHRHAHRGDRLRGAAGRDHLEAEVVEAGRELGRRRLVGVGDGDEDGALGRQRRRRPPPGPCRRRSGSRRRSPSPRRCSSSPGPSTESAPAKRAKGSTASLTLTWPAGRRSGRSWSASFSPSISRAGDLRQRRAGRLGDEGHGARGARVGLDHVELAAGDRRTGC